MQKKKLFLGTLNGSLDSLVKAAGSSSLIEYSHCNERRFDLVFQLNSHCQCVHVTIVIVTLPNYVFNSSGRLKVNFFYISKEHLHTNYALPTRLPHKNQFGFDCLVNLLTRPGV